MIDSEIIIPLKCLVMNESDCLHCKLKDKNDKCQKFLFSDVLGLIDENSRQKAELLHLQNKIELLEMEKKSLKEDSDKSKATAMGVIKRQDAEIKRLLTRLTRFKEEIAQPYILINTDAELTAEMKEAIKKQKPVIVPDNEGTVIRIDKASIRAAAFNEFAERFLKKVHDNHYLLSDRINSKDYGMFTIGIEQAVNETKEEMAGEG